MELDAFEKSAPEREKEFGRMLWVPPNVKSVSAEDKKLPTLDVSTINAIHLYEVHIVPLLSGKTAIHCVIHGTGQNAMRYEVAKVEDLFHPYVMYPSGRVPVRVCNACQRVLVRGSATLMTINGKRRWLRCPTCSVGCLEGTNATPVDNETRIARSKLQSAITRVRKLGATNETAAMFVTNLDESIETDYPLGIGEFDLEKCRKLLREIESHFGSESDAAAKRSYSDQTMQTEKISDDFVRDVADAIRAGYPPTRDGVEKYRRAKAAGTLGQKKIRTLDLD